MAADLSSLKTRRVSSLASVDRQWADQFITTSEYLSQSVDDTRPVTYALSPSFVSLGTSMINQLDRTHPTLKAQFNVPPTVTPIRLPHGPVNRTHSIKISSRACDSRQSV